jgi:hypothetical protein
MKRSEFLSGICGCAAVLASVFPAQAAPDFFAFFNSKTPLPAQLPAAPAEVAGVLEMEKILNRIRAGEPRETWRPLLERFTTFAGEKGVGAGLRELALAWEARARMQEWDAVLLKAYRKKARYPDSIEALLGTVPESLRTDPWGDPWSYAAAAPPHSPKLVGQRYVLVPKRFPKFMPLDLAIKAPPQLPVANLRFSATAGISSLEVNSRFLQPSRSFKVAGERFGNHWVLWLSAQGVILCDENGFMALGFQASTP